MCLYYCIGFSIVILIIRSYSKSSNQKFNKFIINLCFRKIFVCIFDIIFYFCIVIYILKNVKKKKLIFQKDSNYLKEFCVDLLSRLLP